MMSRRPSHTGRGFALLEIMIVLVIIMILVGGYGHFGGFGESVDKGTVTSTMNRANDTACRVSRASAAGNIEMWEMSRVGQAATSVNLGEAGINMRCPHSRTGAMYVYHGGEVYCTEHYPPPAGRSAGRPATDTYRRPQERSSQGSSSTGSQSDPVPNPVWDALGRRPAMP